MHVRSGGAVGARSEARSEVLWAGTSYEEVRECFARYGLLDDQVRFLRGWFRQTLPSAPIERLALLRLDADLYDSTYDTSRRCTRGCRSAAT